MNSHAIVNFGICLTLDDSKTIESVDVFFGGMSSSGLLKATAVEAVLKDTSIADAKSTFAAALEALTQDVARAGASDDPRNSLDYRLSLARSFLYRFFLCAAPSQLPAEYASAITGFAAAEDRAVSSGSQQFASDPAEAPIGEAVIKLSALKQAAGEAIYTSDIIPRGALHGAIVVTQSVGSAITAIQVAAVLKMPGVVDVVLATDIQAGCNQLPFAEPVFLGVGDTSPCVGQAVALVLADTEAQARAAALEVTVTYSDSIGVQAPVQSAAETLETLRKYGGLTRRRVHPAMEAKLSEAAAQGTLSVSIANDHNNASQLESVNSFKGSVKTGSQRHFYMETHSAVAIPSEDTLLVHSSTQDPAYTSAAVAAVVKMPQHKITVKVRRAGGAFGGKLVRHAPVAAAAAVAALKHGE